MLGDLKLKGHKSVVEKKFIHVRVNISGSPLECPGSFFFPILLSVILVLFQLFAWIIVCLICV